MLAVIIFWQNRSRYEVEEMRDEVKKVTAVLQRKTLLICVKQELCITDIFQNKVFSYQKRKIH